MRVLSVATSDQGGGAEQVAWDLFTGLAERGHESYLAVGEKHGSHPYVFEIHASPWFDYRPFAGRQTQFAREIERRWRRARGFEDFTHPYSWHLPHLLPEPPDVVIAHNLHGGFFDLRSLPQLTRDVPLVVVLHDYWPMTGHCAYPFDCERWKHGCGRCPYLDTPPAITRDATRANLRLKRSTYRQSKFTVCSPSRRVLEDAKVSVLNDGVRQHHFIPNGVDLALFHPGDRSAARERLDLPRDIPAILIIGSDPERNPFKDYGCALESVRYLAAEGRSALFVVLGAPEDSTSTVGCVKLRFVAFTPDRSRVAEYFRACDLLLHATRQEVAPLVLSEALASGLPAIASDVGSADDLLGDAGIVVPSGDARAHAAAVAKLLDDPALRRQMGASARQRAETFGGRERMVSAYEELLLPLAARARRSPEPGREPGLPLRPQMRIAMQTDTGPRFTVVYPCTDVRGHAPEHLRAWVEEQTLPSDRYRVIAVVGPGTEDEADIREVLGPNNRLVHESVVTDIAMWNAGAASAETPWLVFTEGHAPGRPDCLEALDRWLADAPGADAGNFAIGHRRDYLMARLSDAWFAEQQAIWREEWPRLHRAGFAIRREVFEEVGGFQPFGQFGVPMLSADLHANGYRVTAVPGAEVVHIDDRTVYDHHFDTIDFVQGECRARGCKDPEFFERYFGHHQGWRNRLTNEPCAARATVLAAIRAATRQSGPIKPLCRHVARMLPRTLLSPDTRVALGENITRVDETLILHTPMPSKWRYRWFVRAHQRVVDHQSLKWIHRPDAEQSPAASPGRWPIDQLGPETLGGVHGLEKSGERLFRWSEPYLRLQLATERPVRHVRLDTGGLRGDPAPVVLLAACGARPLPRSCIRSEQDNTLTISIPDEFWPQAAEQGLTLLLDPLVPSRHGSVDDRELGLPLFAIDTQN